jgi:predicted nucleic acid-binding protein
LPIDATAAEDWGRMIGQQERSPMDTATAAIAKNRNFYVVTRNVRDFTLRGATVINPFVEPAEIVIP